MPGLSSIVMVFEPGRDVYRERQLIQERLTQAHALPHVSRPPTLLQPLSSSSRVLMIGLSSEELSDIDQSVLAQWVLRPKLIGVPGVANISIWGMRDQQLQVLVDPQQLRQQGITLSQVVESAGNAQVVSPLTFLEASTPGTGGFIESPQQRLQVRHLIEKVANPEALGAVPVADTGGRLRLEDVARIRVDHQPLIGDAVVDGGPGVMLVVEKFPGADTRAVTEGVQDALEELSPGLAGLSTDTSAFRPSDFIDQALDNLALVAVAGLALMALVLVACRFRWRSIVVALVTVPVSLLVAALVLDLLGEGLNAIGFAGLAAAVTVVVDEAVVATDRVMRRFRQRRPDDERTRASLIVAASAEVRRPLVYATLIVLLAAAPALVLEGRPGAFFGPAVVAYIVTVLVAVAVALTVAPALTSFLTARWRPTPKKRPALMRVRTRYLATLERLARTRTTTLAAAGACALVPLVVLPFTDTAPVPEFHDDDVVVELAGPPGTADTAMTSYATALSDTLADLPGVEGVAAQVGRAVTGDRVANVNTASVWVRLDSDADHDATLDAIRGAVGELPGVDGEVVTYTSQRIEDIGQLATGDEDVQGDDLEALTGADRPLTVRVYGEDLEVLRAQAERVRAAMADVDGVAEPRAAVADTEPTIEIEVDLEKAQALGLTPGHVRRAEATLVQGIQVGSVFRDQKVFDVIVRGTPAVREDLASVRRMLVDVPTGGHVRVEQVADVRVVQSPSVIERDAVSRFVDVQADVEGRSTGAVVADIEDQIREMDFPIEYHAEVLTQDTDVGIVGPRLIGAIVFAVLAVVFLLQAMFGSWRLAALVFVTLPLSLVGGLLTGLVDGLDLTLGSMLGFLAVFGLAARFTLVLVARLRHLEAESPGTTRHAALRWAASERVAPVGGTALSVVAMTVPVLVLGTRPGLEVLHPMALVVLGGTISAAVVALLLVPALYLHLAPPVRFDTVEMDAGVAMSHEAYAEPGSVPGQGRPDTDRGVSS